MLKKIWHHFTRPVYRMEITLLLFGIIMFNYFLFSRDSFMHDFFRKDDMLKLLFYFYSPLILIFSFFKVPDMFARLGRIAIFTCTLFGILTLEIAVFEEVRRPSIFDVIYHGFIVIQLVILCRLLLLGIIKKADVHEKVTIDLKPDWAANVIVIVWVFGATLGFSYLTKAESYVNAQATYLGGNLLLWLLHYLRKSPVS